MVEQPSRAPPPAADEAGAARVIGSPGHRRIMIGQARTSGTRVRSVGLSPVLQGLAHEGTPHTSEGSQRCRPRPTNRVRPGCLDRGSSRVMRHRRPDRLGLAALGTWADSDSDRLGLPAPMLLGPSHPGTHSEVSGRTRAACQCAPLQPRGHGRAAGPPAPPGPGRRGSIHVRNGARP